MSMQKRSNNFKDLTDIKFNKLTAIKFLRTDKSKHAIWRFLCACGNYRDAVGSKVSGGLVTSCGCLRKGPNSHNWKGGRTKHKDGYISVHFPERRKDNRNKHVLEHRLVMEEHLGRHLNKNENVHHKNGIRDDNRIENLELWTTSQPTGQRVKDKIAWAIEYLIEHKILPKDFKK